MFLVWIHPWINVQQKGIALNSVSPTFIGDGSCGLSVHNTGAHLADYVEGWGPLWAWSTFGFEDMNGTIMDLTHGTGNVCRQVLLIETVNPLTPTLTSRD